MGHANCPLQIFWQRQSDKQTGPQCKPTGSTCIIVPARLFVYSIIFVLFISSIIYFNRQLMANLVSPREIIDIAEQRRC